jgi:pyridoxal phosphate enzyme (YggS family)
MTKGEAATEQFADVAVNWQRVLERVAEAAQRAGRRPEEVTVVAVTKTHPLPAIRAVVEAGAGDLGENYVQELLAKREQWEATAAPPVRWHFIGHLQRNKVKYLVPFCALIHSVDSLALAQEIERRAAAWGRRQPVLIQVNISGEVSKFGLSPAGAAELAEALLDLPHVELRGLMTMAPYAPDPETVRPVYAALRQLRDHLQARGLPPENLRELSMGMSQDFEVAIAEGATLVRIGTAIFGPRHQ